MWSIVIQSTVNLTMFSLFAILINKKRRVLIKKRTLRQSDLYGIVKEIFPSNRRIREMKPTQSKKFVEASITRFVATPDNAYWVKNNVFYTAAVVDGEVLHRDAVPIDTAKLSKDEIDELLYILDNLKKGP